MCNVLTLLLLMKVRVWKKELMNTNGSPERRSRKPCLVRVSRLVLRIATWVMSMVIELWAHYESMIDRCGMFKLNHDRLLRLRRACHCWCCRWICPSSLPTSIHCYAIFIILNNNFPSTFTSCPRFGWLWYYWNR